MTTLGLTGAILALVFIATSSLGQEPPSTPTPTAAPRSVRISFVPPPLEGTISLGIYNEYDQLVRVLHQEAPLEEFTIGPDALVTKWDGKDDFGYDLWPGTYHARGFLVARMKIEEINAAATTDTPVELQSLKIRLVGNPLEKDLRRTIQLTAGIDDEDVLLKTADGLPLLTVTQVPDLKRVALASGRENKVLTVVVESASGVRRFSVSDVSKMMAFDCGEFELR